MRPYTESFEADEVEKISALIEALREIGSPPTKYKIYTSEIANCLSVGLLLAAISVSASVLELFLRDLAVAFTIETQLEGDVSQFGRVERQLEEERDVTVDWILAKLEKAVITPDDAEAIRSFYKGTRIPFAHGLVRRLSDEPALEMLEDMWSLLRRQGQVEDRLEEKALEEIAFVVFILKRYRPWLVRRLSSNVAVITSSR